MARRLLSLLLMPAASPTAIPGRPSRRRGTAAYWMLLALAFAAPARAELWEEVLPAGPGGLVEVEFDLGEGLRPDPGSLTIRSHARDEVRMEIESEGWGTWGLAARLDERAGRVRAEARVSGASTWMFGGPKIRVRLWVPEKTSLEVRAKGGPVRIEELVGSVRVRVRDGDLEIRSIEGDVKLRLHQGDVDVEDIHGSLDVNSTDGDIHAAWISGDVEARSSDGTIRLEHLRGRALAKTLSGDIEVTEVTGPVEARTESGQLRVSFVGAPEGSLLVERGNIEVQVPPGAGFELDAKVTRGELELGPNLLDGQGVSAQAARGQVGSGGGRLVLRSSRGWIRVHGR